MNLYNDPKKHKNAFTLVELIIVISIIGILVLLATPNLMNQNAEAKIAHIRNDVKVVQGKIEEIMTITGEFPKGLDLVNITTEPKEGKVCGTEGLVDKIEKTDYFDITNLAEIRQINSKLDGRFISNEKGKVYYLSEVALGEVDTIPPDDPVIIISPETLTNTDVKVEILYTEDSLIRQYKIGTLTEGEWINYVEPFYVSENTTVYARAIDEAENISNIIEKHISNIDKTPPNDPIIRLNNENPTNQNIFAIIDFSSDSTKKEYKIGSGEWKQYNGDVVITENTTIYARATDEVGNVSNVVSRAITNIDKTPPADPSISLSTENPTNQNVVVTITYSADSTKKEYKVGSGSWQNYTAPITVTENTIIYAKATDSVGNTSNTVSKAITNIDKTPPADPSISLSTENPTNQNVVVTITYSADSTKKEYKIGSDGWQNYTNPITITENTTIYARATDSVGNTSNAVSKAITNIDKTPPQAPQIISNNTDYTPNPIQITINYSADSNKKEYKIGSGSWQNYTSQITISENTTIYARATDIAGNTSESNLEVNNITTIKVLNLTTTNTNSGSMVVDLSDAKQVVKTTTNMGTASITLNGSSSTLTVSGGSQYREVYSPTKYSKTVSDSRTSSNNSFANTINYNSDGYSGTLSKNGASYVVSGSAAGSKWVTGQTTSYYSDSEGYSGYLSAYVYSGSYDSKTASLTSSTYQSSMYYSDSSGYSGYIPYSHSEQRVISGTEGGSKFVQRTLPGHSKTTYKKTKNGYEIKDQDITYQPNYYYSDAQGYSGTLPQVRFVQTSFEYTCGPSVPIGGTCVENRYYTGYYEGTVYKPDTRVYQTIYHYSGTVYRDTRIFRYQGTVTKPDTRVWQQNYTGTVYKGGYDQLYDYSVQIEYLKK